MSISRIEIKNYKSVKYSLLDFKCVNLFIGENGSGKSNILNAITYFFDSLKSEQSDEGIYNYKNKYNNEFSISITFDFRQLKQISRHNRYRDENADYNDYYKWIIKRDNEEVLTLTKIKGKPIRWNHNWQYRQNISNLFPTYFLNAREVNLTDWSKLWEIVGDLMKTHASTEQDISVKLNDIKNDDAFKLSGRFEKLSKAFQNADVQVNKFTPKQYASALTTLLFKGNVFSAKEKSLKSLSTGTSSSNYIYLLIEVLKLISNYKLKEPIILFDEPETSLHHTLIDGLTERIIESKDFIQFVLASHSPRLLKNIIRQSRCESKIFHISYHNDSSDSTSVILFDKNDSRPRTIITDQHACAYFSKFILSVEGATELELFSNEYLLTLFPFLKQIDVVEGMSDAVIQKIVNPKQRHFKTNFLFLVDMDKVLKYSASDNSFSIQKSLTQYSNSPLERFYYDNERTKRLLCRKRIFAIAKKCKFHYYYPFYSCTDNNFIEFISLIKQYCLYYDTYVASTTVEGMLITKENLVQFWTFYISKYTSDDTNGDLIGFFNRFSTNDKVNFVRLLFGGKSDFILKYDQLKNSKNTPDQDLLKLFSNHSVSKTCGWVNLWLEQFFLETADIPIISDAYDKFLIYVKDNNNKQSVISKFEENFPELFAMIKKIESAFNEV